MQKKLKLIIYFLCLIFLFSIITYALSFKKDLTSPLSYKNNYQWNSSVEQRLISVIQRHDDKVNIRISRKDWAFFSYLLPLVFIFIIVFLLINILKLKKTEKKLKESELKLKHNFNYLRTVLDTISTPVFCKDMDGRYTDCNSAFEEYIGLEKDALINKTVYEINQGPLSSIYEKADSELINKKGTQSYETQVLAADGKFHDVIFNKAIICSNDEPIGIVGIIHDITEQKKSENKINRLLKIKEAMIEVNQAIIGVKDINELFNLILHKSLDIMKDANYGSVLLLNENNILVKAASVGYDWETRRVNIPLEHSFYYLKTKGRINSAVIIENIDELYVDEYVNFSKKNFKIKTSISTPIIINNKLFGFLNIDSDKKDIFNQDDVDLMNYMKQKIENAIKTLNLYNEIIYLSKYDELTNLYNRRSFEELFDKILKAALKYNESFLLVVFDLNKLKFANDTYGHLQGDKYIKSFVNKLKGFISESDILARYGGDEFIGVFSNINLNSLIKKFEELNNYFADNPIILEGSKITYSYSYGIAAFPSDATTYTELVKIADERMYSYKQKFKE